MGATAVLVSHRDTSRGAQRSWGPPSRGSHTLILLSLALQILSWVSWWRRAITYGGTLRWVASSSPIVLSTGCKAAGSTRQCHPEEEGEPIYSAGNGGCK